MSAVPQTPPVPSGRETADLLVDSALLSDLVGAPVRASRLRHKPGLSTVGALLPASPRNIPDPRTARGKKVVPGWVQATRPDHLDKLRNALRRASDRGQQIHVSRVSYAGGELHLAHGDLDTDPRLQRGLDAVRSAYPSVRQPLAAGALSVLRYNPQRRLVLRRESPGREAVVIRVTAHKQREVGRVPAVLAAAGIPVVEPVPVEAVRRSRRVSLWPWYGIGHLGDTGLGPAAEGSAAQEAGAVLARLHRASHLLEGAGAPFADVTGTAAETRGLLGPLVRDLAHLDVWAADRMAVLVGRVAERTDALDPAIGPVHGDFSADQVLVGGPAEDGIRLIDFDRAGSGPLALDLATFAAVELLEAAPTTRRIEDLALTGDLLAGYRAGGGTVPPAHELRTWVARALLARAVEPFRAADPGWVDGIHRRLDQVGEVLRR